MTLRHYIRPNVMSILLASTALATSAAWASPGVAATQEQPIVIAQAPSFEAIDRDKAKEKAQEKIRDKIREKVRNERSQRTDEAPEAQPPAAASPPAVQIPRPAPPAAEQPPARPKSLPGATQERREDRRDQRRDDRASDPRPEEKKQAPAVQVPRPAPPAAEQPPARPQSLPGATQERREDRRDQRRDDRASDPRPEEKKQAPAEQPRDRPDPAAQTTAPGVVPPPTRVRDAREFMRRPGERPERKVDEVRRERREIREGDRLIIREGDRNIIREGERTIVRHNESNRFAVNARNVRTERRGANVETVVERGDGVRIISVVAPDGRLIRRARRDRDGREIVLIDNSFAVAGAVSMFIQLAEPEIRIPRDRYVVEMRRARSRDIYGAFIAPPVVPIVERYTLEQVRYNAPLRNRMPRVDLDITFETGSWQLSSEQVDRLSVIAENLNRVIERNPREVFLVEGHTDAVGSDEDNLLLSDRRAESVAVALTVQFNVPPENLVTQGYGKRYLKVQTSGPEEANRRVAVRRITPLMEQQARNTGAR